jgi:hypothetical protein
MVLQTSIKWKLREAIGLSPQIVSKTSLLSGPIFKAEPRQLLSSCGVELQAPVHTRANSSKNESKGILLGPES